MAVKSSTSKKKSPAAKQTTTKESKKVVKKAASSKKKVKRNTTPVQEVFTKTQLQAHLAEATELSRKQIASVFEELAAVVERHVKKNAVGEFTLPGLLKVRVVRKPATKARKGVNPFTGQEQMFKAKPARNVVKLRALKGLKDMAA